MVNVLRYFAIGIVFISLLGGAILLWLFSIDANNVDNLFFKIVAGLSSVMFISGIGLVFYSKKKPDPFAESIRIIKEETPSPNQSQARQPIPNQYRTETRPEIPAPRPAYAEMPESQPSEEQMQYYTEKIRSNPELLSKISGQAPIKENLSFEDEMKLKKRQYYGALPPESTRLGNEKGKDGSKKLPNTIFTSSLPSNQPESIKTETRSYAPQSPKPAHSDAAIAQYAAYLAQQEAFREQPVQHEPQRPQQQSDTAVAYAAYLAQQSEFIQREQDRLQQQRQSQYTAREPQVSDEIRRQERYASSRAQPPPLPPHPSSIRPEPQYNPQPNSQQPPRPEPQPQYARTEPQFEPAYQPRSQQPKSEDKVKLNIGWPFKKKENKLRDLLEEESQKSESSWRQ